MNGHSLSSEKRKLQKNIVIGNSVGGTVQEIYIYILYVYTAYIMHIYYTYVYISCVLVFWLVSHHQAEVLWLVVVAVFLLKRKL